MNKPEHKVSELILKIAEMESDIKTTIEVFSAVLTEFGIDVSAIDKAQGGFAGMLPTILSKLTVKVMGGNFNPRTLESITAITPVIAKYSYLTAEKTEIDG